MSAEEFKSRKPELSESEKELIRRYMLRAAIPSGIALSVLTFVGGFLINEVARGDAYTKAYEAASSRILDTASKTAEAAGQVAALRERGEKLVDESERAITGVKSALQDAEAALNRAIGLQKTLEQMQAAQADAVARKLANDQLFVSSVTAITSNAVIRINSDLQQTQQTLTAIKASNGVTAIRGTDPSVANHEGSVDGLSGTYNIHQDFVACPPGTFVSAIQGFVGSGGVLRQIRYACRSI
ncbi:hypothetical protein [Neorhizobium sp. LjRoot104]|uniref:hypothetical protein n=1 Tax=Neorhizobium sp. LjRoot104 TaxID=3342254 RepID=UPI003ECCA727